MFVEEVFVYEVFESDLFVLSKNSYGIHIINKNARKDSTKDTFK